MKNKRQAGGVPESDHPGAVGTANGEPSPNVVKPAPTNFSAPKDQFDPAPTDLISPGR